MQGRSSSLRVVDPEDRVAAVMAEHGRTLLRTANHFSLCHDDALDAYQRALEIFLRRADRVLPETEVAWLKVVVLRTIGPMTSPDLTRRPRWSGRRGRWASHVDPRLAVEDAADGVDLSMLDVHVICRACSSTRRSGSWRAAWRGSPASSA